MGGVRQQACNAAATHDRGKQTTRAARGEQGKREAHHAQCKATPMAIGVHARLPRRNSAKQSIRRPASTRLRGTEMVRGPIAGFSFMAALTTSFCGWGGKGDGEWLR